MDIKSIPSSQKLNKLIFIAIPLNLCCVSFTLNDICKAKATGEENEPERSSYKFCKTEQNNQAS